MKKIFIFGAILLSLLAGCSNNESNSNTHTSQTSHKHKKSESEVSNENKKATTSATKDTAFNDFLSGSRNDEIWFGKRGKVEIKLNADGNFIYNREYVIKNPNLVMDSKQSYDLPYIIPSLKDITVDGKDKTTIKATLSFKGKWGVENGKITISNLKFDGDELHSFPSPEEYSFNELKDKMSQEDFDILTTVPDFSEVYLLPTEITPKSSDRHDTSEKPVEFPDTIEKVKNSSVSITKENLEKIDSEATRFDYTLLFIDHQFGKIYNKFYQQKEADMAAFEQNSGAMNTLYQDPIYVPVHGFSN